MTIKESEWSRFAAGLFGYISDGRNRFIRTNYEITLNMSDGAILHELQTCTSTEQLSPELRKIAKIYKESVSGR